MMIDIVGLIINASVQYYFFLVVVMRIISFIPYHIYVAFCINLGLLLVQMIGNCILEDIKRDKDVPPLVYDQDNPSDIGKSSDFGLQ